VTGGAQCPARLGGTTRHRPLCATIADALDDLLLPCSIDLSVFAALNHPELQAHIQRVGQVFYEQTRQG